MVSHAAAIEVGVQRDRLADAHLLQLDLLEVGVDMHLIERHHGQQRHAGLDALAELDLALGDDAVERRFDRPVRSRSTGLLQARARSHDLGLFSRVVSLISAALASRGGNTQLEVTSGALRGGSPAAASRPRRRHGHSGAGQFLAETEPDSTSACSGA